MNKNYSAGYLPKIQYWTNEYYTNLIAGITAYEKGNNEAGEAYNQMVGKAIEKINYFQTKQNEWMAERSRVAHIQSILN